MPHIYFLCSGTRGDVQPYVTLGLRLRAEGHAVTIATHPPFRQLVEAHGLRFGLMEGNPSDAMMRTGGWPVFSPGTDLRESLGWLREMRAVYACMLESAWQTCREAEALVLGLPTMWGTSIAEAVRMPLIIAPLQPLTRTRAYPSAILPSTFSIGSAYNLATHRLAELALWLPWRGVINTWRAATLGLRALPLSGPFPELYARVAPFVYGFSPRVVPRPDDWPAHHTLAGYWPAPPTEWQPPAELQLFLVTGTPPVYVGFGSMGSGMVRSIAEALADLGMRVIAPASSGISPSANICVVNDVPHDWLFPKLAAVIHHGGAGTTGTALRAGVPQLVVPFAVDQFFWGRRMFELGVGACPMPHATLKPQSVVTVVQRVIEDSAMRQRARELAVQIAKEDGVGTAAQLIGAYVRNGK